MKIEQYAPVIIPTLNRFVHFQRCLESLERCLGAEYTDVYVGLDYPPAEKYVEGWRKIDEYLAEKEKKNGFRNLFVFRRDHNCGIEGECSNYALLVKTLRNVTDRYISSEDDNEFSPMFLEYMNQGLELYKNDDKVIFVAAYTAPFYKDITKEKSFFAINVSAYGLGHWINKDWAKKYSNSDIERDLKKSFLKLIKMYFAWPRIINMTLAMIKGNHQWGDIRYTIYNLVHKTFVLYPSVSLSRNWGCDGSGVHSPIMPEREREYILMDGTIDLKRIPFAYPKDLRKRIFYGTLSNSLIRNIKVLVMGFFRLISFYFKK